MKRLDKRLTLVTEGSFAATPLESLLDRFFDAVKQLLVNLRADEFLGQFSGSSAAMTKERA